jgi:hypothetical protein
MERSIAIRKLGKLLGKSLGYRVDPKAPDQEQREAARAELPASRELRTSLNEAMNARRREILAADAEYQRLKADYDLVQKRCEELAGIVSHYRITVGTSNGMFFTIRAQGDSWGQVIEKLTTERKSA